MGLTLVPTPLGNLRDITLRALDVLRNCDLVAAEDTRVARRLLSAYDLPAKSLVSYREQNAAAVTAPILEAARSGSVALLSDAGMPGVADPGRELVVAARAAGIAVEALPGPVAYVCGAVLSGFDLNGLRFGGFLPRRAGARRKELAAALAGDGPTAWYESPHRLVATLQALDAMAPQARIFVVRELSKLHEQQILGRPQDVIAAVDVPVRGEIVLVLAPLERIQAVVPDDVDARIEALLDAGLSAAAAARTLSGELHIARSQIYAWILQRQRARKELRR